MRGSLLTKPKENPESAPLSKPVKVVEPKISYVSEDHPAYTDEQRDKRISNLIGKPCCWRNIFDANTQSTNILEESIVDPNIVDLIENKPFREQKHK